MWLSRRLSLSILNNWHSFQTFSKDTFTRKNVRLIIYIVLSIFSEQNGKLIWIILPQLIKSLSSQNISEQDSRFNMVFSL